MEESIIRVAEKFEIDDKIVRAERLINELEPLLYDLKEYGFDSPDYIYLAPFGEATTPRGKAFLAQSFRAYNEEQDKESII